MTTDRPSRTPYRRPDDGPPGGRPKTRRAGWRIYMGMAPASARRQDAEEAIAARSGTDVVVASSRHTAAPQRGAARCLEVVPAGVGVPRSGDRGDGRRRVIARHPAVVLVDELPTPTSRAPRARSAGGRRGDPRRPASRSSARATSSTWNRVADAVEDHLGVPVTSASPTSGPGRRRDRARHIARTRSASACATATLSGRARRHRPGRFFTTQPHALRDLFAAVPGRGADQEPGRRVSLQGIDFRRSPSGSWSS